MKTKFLFSLACLALLLLCFSACQRSGGILPSNYLNNANAPMVNANIIGKVLDSQHQPIALATVHIGKAIVKTDAKGFFYIKNTPLPADYGYVSVEKAGFFNASRTFKVREGRTHYLTMEMLAQTQRGAFSAASGGSVSFDGVNVSIPGNGVVRSNGSPYIGVVKVVGQYLSPDAANINEIMPGNLWSKTSANKILPIETYGMVAVELHGDNGEKLQIAPGKEATLDFPVAASQSTTTPSEIPLWYFDEVSGFWKEEGKATLQNGRFVGNVKHFTYWNCDMPIPHNTELYFNLVDAYGNPMANYDVWITAAGYTYGTHGYTDNLGAGGGFIPNGVPVTITVYDAGSNYWSASPCILLQQVVGPFTNPVTNIGNLVVNNPNNINGVVSGVVTDCNNNPLSNALVLYTVSGNSSVALFTNANGGYSFSYSSCLSSPTVDIMAQDLVSMVQSPVTSTTVTGGNTVVNVQACGVSISEYVNALWNGNSQITTNPNAIYCSDSLVSGLGALDVYTYDNAQSQVQISFNVNELVGGGYDITNVSHPNYNSFVITAQNVTNYPTAIGFYLDCSFSGTAINATTNATEPFSVTVHIKRDW